VFFSSVYYYYLHGALSEYLIQIIKILKFIQLQLQAIKERLQFDKI